LVAALNLTFLKKINFLLLSLFLKQIFNSSPNASAFANVLWKKAYFLQYLNLNNTINLNAPNSNADQTLKKVSILPENPENCALLEKDSRELLEQ